MPGVRISPLGPKPPVFVRKAGGLDIFQRLIFRCNIRFGDIIFFQKLLQIAAITNQHNLTEFPRVDILEPSHLLSGADARPNHWLQILPVIGALFRFPSKHMIPTQNSMVSGADVKEEKVAVAFLK